MNIIDIYPWESAYSYISRLSVHSGYIWNVDFRKEVLNSSDAVVDYNFLNFYNDKFLK